MKTTTRCPGTSANYLLRRLLAAAFALTCLAPLRVAQAVSPAPDGGYPNGNTAEGTNALNSLTTGGNNTALGFQALFNDTSGSANTATGADALLHNTTGVRNSAIWARWLG